MAGESGKLIVEPTDSGLRVTLRYTILSRDFYRSEHVPFKSWVNRKSFDARMLDAAESIREWNRDRLYRLNLAEEWEERLNYHIM
jgi:hypothetical protein